MARRLIDLRGKLIVIVDFVLEQIRVQIVLVSKSQNSKYILKLSKVQIFCRILLY